LAHSADPEREAQAANDTLGPARASMLFPSDEKRRAARALHESGPFVFGRRQATFQRMVMWE
jgi:hypothetical protein